MAQNYIWPATISSAPAGSATAANQVLEIAQLTAINANTDGLEASNTAIAASVASIDTKTPTVGQKAMAASSPVVIASDQSAIPVSGTVSTGGLTDAELRASPVPVSLTSTTITGSVAVTGPLTDAQLRASPVPVSGTVSTGGLTDAELRASPVPVSLTSTTITGTVAVTQSGSWTVTANAGTNLNTSALNLEATQSAMSAKLPATLGQKTMANSMAVVVASDQSAIPVTSTPAVPAALTVKQAAITVGTSAVRLTTDGSAPSSTRRVLIAQVDPSSAATFYIGSSSVTSSGATRGIQMVAASAPFIANDDAGDYYIISGTAAQTVFIVEQE